VGHALLLVLSHHGVVGASICLPWEPKHVRMLCMVDQWAWPPLVVRAMLGAHSSVPSMTLGTPRMVPGVVHEQLPPQNLGSISSRVPGAKSFTWPLHRL
jgi:hypothetical protein